MILTKYEMMIIFGLISPIIIPLTIMSMKINYYSYQWIILKQKWSIKPFDTHIQMPVGMLWFSLLLSQIFICVFSFACIDREKKGYSYLLVVIIIIIDFVFIVRHIKIKARRKNHIKQVTSLKINDEYYKPLL
eukprot:426569_1